MGRPTATSPPPQDRLDSWKEIAAYLNRGVRTVQRWEREKGLPIRRLPGGDQARVHALRSELDRWWDSRDGDLYSETATKSCKGEVQLDRPDPRSLWRRSMLGIVMTASVLIGAVLLVSDQNKSLSSKTHPVPLVSMGGWANRPSLAPDGDRFAFKWIAPAEFSHRAGDDRCGIYVKEIAGGPPVRLTNSEMDRDPSWSPDSRQIAFVRGYGKETEIRLVPAAGGPELKIASLESGRYSHLSWTPDSQFLLISTRDSLDEPYALWALSVRSAQRRQILVPPPLAIHHGDDTQGDLVQSISPDGTIAVFARTIATGTYRLFAIRLTHDLRAIGTPWPLIDRNHSYILGVAWIGEREIVYAASDGLSRLWQVRVSESSSPQLVTWASPMAEWPTAARTKRRLIYATATFITELWKRDMQSGESRLLISSDFRQWSPSYSPDGYKIAFSSNRSGDAEVWTCEADGQNCRQLTFIRDPCCVYPRWSPDGRQLSFESRVTGKPQVYVISADGGEPHKLTEGDSQNQLASWSRDGQWIYFESDRSGQWRVWRIPVRGGTAVQVTHMSTGAVLESFDRQIFVAGLGFEGGMMRNGPLFRVEVGRGEETQVAARILNFNSFSATRRGVYFMQNPSTLQFLDPATREIKTMMTRSGEAVSQGISVSSDDRFMVFNKTARSSANIMMAVNEHAK